jgi:predicted acylesterase/phospholipase RssA
VDGNLLVDGGIVNNLPVDVMKGFSGGATVIAVDPTPRMDPALTADYGFGVSGWRLLANRMSPFTGSKPVAPSLATTLARIVGFGGMARADALEERDLYLALPLEKFKFNEFHRGPEIAELAYRFALPRLSEWKAENWR